MSTTLLSGPKFSSSHQTYIPDAVDMLFQLKALDCVKKIFLGEITTTKPGILTAKISQTEKQGVYSIIFRGVNAVQKFTVVLVDTSEGSVKSISDIVELYKSKKKAKKKDNKKPVVSTTDPLNKKKMKKRDIFVYTNRNKIGLVLTTGKGPTLGESSSALQELKEQISKSKDEPENE